MTSSPSDFKRAIDSYGFPREEPIFYVDLNWSSEDPGHPHEPVVLFRPAGPEAEWHSSIEAFWASALFNYLEDRVDDARFEELGESGEYRAIAVVEAHRVLGDLIGAARSDYITVPVHPLSCFLVYNDPDLKAVVGTDSAGYFAVIRKSCGAETTT
ncbi:MAG: hypothetical protein IT426_01120 [Pirellulales bacterium]|nr:hypothetical protein [Pirellulales bacterium]